MTTDIPRSYSGPNMALGATLIVGLTLAAAFMGRLFPAGEWYEALARPSWTPPNWVFGPVWGVLYLAIAAAGFIAWRQGASLRTLSIWLVALLLNALWSPVFFGAELPVGGVIVIALLWIAILLFIIDARQRAWVASLLFVPYLIWITFALALNAAIVAMNA